MGWKRARQPELKLQRRDAIMRAAAELLDARDLAEASLSAIARASRISKANIYRYFDSREAIFLELLIVEQRAVIEAVERELASQELAAGRELERVADVVTDIIAGAPRYLALISSMASVLEHNANVESIRGFKRRIVELNLRGVNALHAALPWLPLAEARRAMLHIFVYTSGLWPVANPSPAVREATDCDELRGLRVDFRSALRDHMLLILRGLRAERSPSAPPRPV